MVNISPTRKRPRKRARRDADALPSASLETISQYQSESNIAVREHMQPVSLIQYCIKVIAENAETIVKTMGDEYAKYLLREIPPHVQERLLPAIARTAQISENLLINFTLPHMEAIRIPGPCLLEPNLLKRIGNLRFVTTLDLTNQSKLLDKELANALVPKNIPTLPVLSTLILGGCVKVGDSTVRIASQATHLRCINLNYTATTTEGITHLLARAKNLEVLKLAFVSNLKPANVIECLDRAVDLAVGYRHVPLSKLIALKLKGTAVSDAAVDYFVRLCKSTLQRLDISLTKASKLSFLKFLQPWNITKLLLNGLPLSPKAFNDLKKHLLDLPNDELARLRYLGLSDIGINGLGTPLNDALFGALLPILQKCQLGRLNLARNHLLGTSVVIWIDFFDMVVINLVRLDISALTRIDFARLFSSSDDAYCFENMQTVVLNDCKVSDSVLGFICHCPNLEELYIKGSLISVQALVRILRDCPKLRTMNLTSCRGIPVELRRNVFEAWDKDGLDSYINDEYVVE